MKYRLLDFLQCPDCKGKLKVQVFDSKKTPTHTDSKLVDNNLCPLQCQNPSQQISKSKEINNHCKECYETEITEGLLTCECGKIYPIIGDIPRFLPSFFDDHLEFTSKYFSYIRKYGINSNHLRKLFYGLKNNDTKILNRLQQMGSELPRSEN